MNRLCIATRSISSWRERLADPETQWQRYCSAFETAVSWELADSRPSGLPKPIENLFDVDPYGSPRLLLAIAEHKVKLDGQGGDSQNDVWALIETVAGNISLTVEAKAAEPFGEGNESLGKWLDGQNKDSSKKNRQVRWKHIESNLPHPDPEGAGYSPVAYQILHRCASAVIEARRFNLQHAAFVVQAFQSPEKSFKEFQKLCHAMGLTGERNRLQMVTVDEVTLGVGWVDCDFASDKQVVTAALGAV